MARECNINENLLTFFFNSIFSFMKKDCQEKAFNKLEVEDLSVLMLDSLVF